MKRVSVCSAKSNLRGHTRYCAAKMTRRGYEGYYRISRISLFVFFIYIYSCEYVIHLNPWRQSASVMMVCRPCPAYVYIRFYWVARGNFAWLWLPLCILMPGESRGVLGLGFYFPSHSHFGHFRPPRRFASSFPLFTISRSSSPFDVDFTTTSFNQMLVFEFWHFTNFHQEVKSTPSMHKRK